MGGSTLTRVAMELLSRRYEAFRVRSPGDTASCEALVEGVRRGELRRAGDARAIETGAIDEARAEGELFAVRERKSGRIVGCVRGIFARSVADHESTRGEYRLDVIPPALVDRTGIAARMVVLPEHRKSAASLVLTRALYQYSVRECGLVLFCVSCEPALLALYTAMGYRPIGRVWAKSTGGYRVPTLLVGHDLEHMEAIRSPLLPVLRGTPRPWPEDAVRWFRGVAPSLPDPGVHRWRDADHPSLRMMLEGLSSAGRRTLLEHAMLVEGRPGDLAFREGDGVRGLAIVIDGSVDAVRGGAKVAELGAGGILGITTTVLGGAREASAVVSRPGTRLLLLSRGAHERLRSPADQAALWRNLSRLLARRLSDRLPLVEGGAAALEVA
ncbi:MAG: cyclic nucleotide-binding domain-containing protein [Nannocystaceae bacterium]